MPYLLEMIIKAQNFVPNDTKKQMLTFSRKLDYRRQKTGLVESPVYFK